LLRKQLEIEHPRRKTTWEESVRGEQRFAYYLPGSRSLETWLAQPWVYRLSHYFFFDWMHRLWLDAAAKKVEVHLVKVFDAAHPT
jgi:hypothetical protein